MSLTGVGLTPQGFVAPSQDDIVADLKSAFQSAFGLDIDLSDESPYMQVIGIMAERFSELWALGQGVYASGTPDGASDAQLDDVCSITGTLRDQPTPSTVKGTATGTPSTLLSAGRVASTVSVATRFTTLADATITSVSAWAGSTSYTVGGRVTNGGNVYVCITAGSSASSGGPTGTGTNIADSSVRWKYVGVGTGAIDVAMESEDTGPLAAPAGSLTTIETPVAGWSSITNLLDAERGTNLESNPDLRLKREDELATAGTSPVEAIRSNLLEVEGVTAATVFENPTDTTDGTGLPPHAIECLVQGGADVDVRAAIFANKAGGIGTHGTTTGTVTDSSGNVHEVDFSRPTEIDVWVIISVTYDSTEYPADGDTEIVNAIVTQGNQQKAGKDVNVSGVSARAYSVPGVIDIPPTTVLIGTTNPPTTTTPISISTRQIAKFDTGRVTVISTAGTP